MRKYLCLATSILASLLIACGQPDAQTGTASNTPVVPTPAERRQPEVQTGTAANASMPPAQATISAQIAAGNVTVGEYVTAHSLKVRIAISPIIVIGQITGTGEVINMARSIYDINKPDPTLFGVGQVYHFQVQQYLKGNGPDTLNIVQPEGLISADPATVSATDIQRSKTNSVYEYTAFRTGTTYLFLLQPLEGFDPKNNYFTGGIHPWKFVVGSDGNLIMEAPGGAVAQLPADFIPDPDGPLLPQIEQAIQAEQAAKP